MESFGQENPGSHLSSLAGRGGGVILTTATAVGETVEVAYSYTDLVVLSALWSNIVERPEAQRRRLSVLRRELESETTGSVEIPRSAFVRAGTPVQLLALAGLHSSIDSAWRSKMLDLLRHENLKAELPAPARSLRRQIAMDLDKLARPLSR